MMEIKSHFETVTGTWTYLVADTVSGKAALIDPVLLFDPVSGHSDSSYIQGILDEAEQLGYQLDWVIETHVHADHLSAARFVCQASGAKLAASHAVRAVQKNFVAVFNLEDVPTDGSQFDRLLFEGDVLELGDLRLQVLETPGHTPDGISLLVEDAAFIGDTLFAPPRGSARCDFPGGGAGILFDSVQKLYALPEQTRLFLCHDYPTEGQAATASITVAESRSQNIHIKAETSREDFIALREGRDAKLSLPRLILPSVQFNLRGGQEIAPENNGVTYLKIPLNKAFKNSLA
ncbi:MAG: MBL fold metallo-hydrolase [Xanthomonadales bacterium]|nr:MBL fold metallo-hydrolase [Xanthomonadales bacterium]